MSFKRYFYSYERYSYGIIMFSMLYLTIAYLIIYLVDFMNVFNLQENIEVIGSFPPLWVTLFKERSITEYLQWTFLGLSFLLAIYLRGFQVVSYTRPIKTWVFLQVGLLLMFAEDTINTRHLVVYYTSQMLKVDYQYFMKTDYAIMIEVFLYLLLGVCMLVFLLKVFKDKNESMFGKKLLILSYFLYGIASVASATRFIGNWYHVAGSTILNLITPQFDLDWSASTITVDDCSLGFWFMDLVVEESIELMGAAFMLAAMLAFITYPAYKNRFHDQLLDDD